jgi:hypothetical protein
MRSFFIALLVLLVIEAVTLSFLQHNADNRLPRLKLDELDAPQTLARIAQRSVPRSPSYLIALQN